jgi:hypothetical protein
MNSPPVLEITDLYKNAKPVVLTKKPKWYSLAKPTRIAIGPMNAKIDFTNVPPPPPAQQVLYGAVSTALPETWSWRPDQIDETVDVGARLEAKKGIGPILAQGLCGSCWAFAIASTMNDVFSVAGKFIHLPPGAGSYPVSGISPTALMSCFRSISDGCDGASVSTVLLAVLDEGVWTSPCYDYWWIEGNNRFNGDSTGHFSASTTEMNAAIPECGCARTSMPRKKFRVKQVNSLPVYGPSNGTTTSDLAVTWNDVRAHMWNYGPVIGGFVVYVNFYDGEFASTDGVYFEDGKYPLPRGETNPKRVAGAHAVKVVGWGVQKNCRQPDGTTKDTPYWMCANSWGTSWGDKGYWKMARYPFNKISQFDVLVSVRGVGTLGGFLVFKAGEIYDQGVPQVTSRFRETVNPERASSGFYDQDVEIKATAPVTVDIEPTPAWKEQVDVFVAKLAEQNWPTLLGVGAGIVVFLFVAYRYYSYLKKKRGKK